MGIFRINSMKMISQAMGWSVYAIDPAGGAMPYEAGRGKVRETTRDRQGDETRAEGRDRGGSLHGDRNEHEGPDGGSEGVPGRLCRECQRGRERIREGTDGERPEEERLQSPHATLPSPAANVSASA